MAEAGEGVVVKLLAVWSGAVALILGSLVASPVAAETALAASSNSTSGLAKRPRNWRQTAWRCGFSAFGPKRARRSVASRLLRPAKGSSFMGGEGGGARPGHARRQAGGL